MTELVQGVKTMRNGPRKSFRAWKLTNRVIHDNEVLTIGVFGQWTQIFLRPFLRIMMVRARIDFLYLLLFEL